MRLRSATPGQIIRPMAKVFFSHDEILERPNKRFPDEKDPFRVHYHFRPARPADLCVTLDPDTGEVNISAGTMGPLTWNPYTFCLHISIHGSPHTYRNLVVGGDCVVGLPGRDIVKETWFTALPLPRGISEAEVAGLHTFASKFVPTPGIVECPVNFECKVEFKKDYHTHGIFFLRVVGASIDEKVLSLDREAVISWYPTYEVDDAPNKFGGSIERLGIMGGILPCPTFPLAPKAGWYQSFERWMRDLAEEKYLDAGEAGILVGWQKEFDGLFGAKDSPRRGELKELITRACRLIVTEDWEGLHFFLGTTNPKPENL